MRDLFICHNSLSCNVACSAGEELLWHYRLRNGEQRVRLADTLHGLSCASPASNATDESDLGEVIEGLIRAASAADECADNDAASAAPVASAAVSPSSPAASVTLPAAAVSPVPFALTVGLEAGGSVVRWHFELREMR